MNNNLSTALEIFDDKNKIAINKNFSLIAMDKNFSPDTRITDSGEVKWKYDLEKNFDLPANYINDVIMFLLKKTYDQPYADCISFDINEISTFHGKSKQHYDRLNITKKTIKTPEDYVCSNNLEVTLFTIHKTNLLINRNYFVPSDKEKQRQIYQSKGFQIVTSFEIEQVTKQKKIYHVQLNPVIIRNSCSFLFYTSIEDYKFISSTLYRNSNLKLYYQRILNLYNNLRNKKDDQLSFDEIVHILKLSGEARFIKPKITKNTNLLLEFPLLKGLKFKWIPNPNGYAYKPYFYIESGISNQLIIESEEQKFQRLDIYLIMLLKEWSVDLTKPYKKIITPLYLALENSYEVIFKREPTRDEKDEFFIHFRYKKGYPSHLQQLQQYQKLNSIKKF